MTKKKAKTKKHKKERKRSPTPPFKDRGKRKDDKETCGKHKGRSRHEHVSRRKSTDCTQSNTNDGLKRDTYKKSDGKNSQTVFKGSKPFQVSDHRALHGSAEHSSSRHYVSSTAKCSNSQSPSRPARDVSSKELEEQRKKLVKRRRSPEPRPRSTKSVCEEETKKLVKRKSSTEEDHPATKKRSIKEQADVVVEHRTSEELSQHRRKLVERRSRELSKDFGECSTRSHTKIESNRSKATSSSVKNQASALIPKATQYVCPKTQDNNAQRGRSDSTHLLSSSKELLSHPPVKFKISKKSNVVKAQTDKNVWDHDGKSKMSALNKTHTVSHQTPNTAQQQNELRPSEVPYRVPLCSEPRKPLSLPHIQPVQPDLTREKRSPSKAPTEQTVCQGTSAELTETFDNDQEMQLVEELHLARSDQRLQVNVVESYGELTCMDVDPPEEGTTMAHSQNQQELLIVLDTNVLLSHLDFVKKMRSHGLGALGFPTLLIPWVVLQELDALKSGQLSQNVEWKARPAVHYIYSCLKSQEPRLWGQSMQQASQISCQPGFMNNDDRVLQCCLQYQMLYPDGTLILCTNDKNLCSKALLSGVKALSKADLVKHAEVNPGLLNLSYSPGLLNLSYSQKTAHPPAGHSKEGHALTSSIPHIDQERKPCNEEETSKRHTAVAERDLSECVSVLESSLLNALSAVLEEEMKAAFGELWTEIVYLKPPWTLETVLQCFRKHWIAVFGIIIKRNKQSCVETLSSCLCSGASIERDSFLTVLSVAEELLMAFSSRSQYSGHIAQTLSCLQTLQHRLQGQKTPLEDTTDGDTLMAEAAEDVAPPLHTSHQEVWAFFESLWNNLCQVSSALFSALHYSPVSRQTVQPFSTPSSQDALTCLHRLSAALRQLLEAFQRVLSVDSTVEDAQALLLVVHTSEVAAMEPRFTAKDLFECLSQQEYSGNTQGLLQIYKRFSWLLSGCMPSSNILHAPFQPVLPEYGEKLCIGGAQLMELRTNLDHCAAAVCSQSGSNT